MPLRSLSNHRASHSTLADKARALAVILREEFGVPFICCDATGAPLDAPDAVELPAAELTPEAVARLTAEGRVQVTLLPDRRYRLALVLAESGQATLMAMGVVAALAPAGAEAAEQERLE